MFVSLGSIVSTSGAAIVSTIAVKVCAPVLGGAVFCSIVSSLFFFSGRASFAPFPHD
jgi:hypothetical protein